MDAPLPDDLPPTETTTAVAPVSSLMIVVPVVTHIVWTLVVVGCAAMAVGAVAGLVHRNRAGHSGERTRQ